MLEQLRFAYTRRSDLFWGFCASAAIIMITHQYWGIDKFHWDSGVYWYLSELGRLMNFPEAIRGYAYPMLLSPLRFVSDQFQFVGFMPYRVGTAIAYAFALSVMLPSLFYRCFGGKVSFLRRTMPALLLCIFFPGLIVYPLSDLPALCMLGVAAWLIVFSKDETSKRKYIYVFIAGIFAYMSFNTRSIYIFSYLVAIFIILFFAKYKLRAKFVAVILFATGSLLASIPQIAINLKHYDTFSPLVQSTEKKEMSLFAYQLLWGITFQKYETSIDPSSPGAALFYMDRAGEALFEDAEIDSHNFSVAAYFQLALTHPLELLGIAGRHIVNGMDVRDGEVYTSTPSSEKRLLPALNFILIFACLTCLGWVLSRRTEYRALPWRSALWAGYFLLPVAAVIPGAIETRFFLPLHLALYSTLAFRTERELGRVALTRCVPLTIVFVMTASLFFAISLTTMSSLQYTFNEKYWGPR